MQISVRSISCLVEHNELGTADATATMSAGQSAKRNAAQSCQLDTLHTLLCRRSNEVLQVCRVGQTKPVSHKKGGNTNVKNTKTLYLHL